MYEDVPLYDDILPLSPLLLLEFLTLVYFLEAL
jgi:hypothetical protein